MLADANEEKEIQAAWCRSFGLCGLLLCPCSMTCALQVAIIRDEVLEKQQQIQELTRQKNETEADACTLLTPCLDSQAQSADCQCLAFVYKSE